MRPFRLAVAAVAATLVVTPALAELTIPSLSYRTGPYAPNGIPFADGYADYFTLINERDGGVNGVRINLIECETGYNTDKGVECYESVKAQGALVIQPLSTGITYQVIPRATADDIPVHSMGYGRTSAADGTVFSHVFNFPGTYWDAASIIVSYIRSEEGGDLNGKKIALVYHDSAYGREPIRTLEALAERHGFELLLFPVEHPGQEQRATWVQIRQQRPDYIMMWGWGVMNQVAIREAANIRFPMENFIGVWWSGTETDVEPAGAAANGYKAINFHAPGSDFPVYADIQTYVIDRGLAAGDGSSVGEVLYNRGMVAAMYAVEAARKAMEIHGTTDLTPGMMRDGYEALEITEARLEELGLAGFAPPLTVTCENHGGPGLGLIQQWDAEAGQWNVLTGYLGAERDVVDALIAEDASAYAAENSLERRCN